MPSLGDVNIKVSTSSDTSGVKSTSSAIGGMVDDVQAGLRKVSEVTAVAGVALTAFSKSSVDYLKEVVTDSKNLARQTGLTVEQSSSLLAVMHKMGISADQTSVAFRTFSKQIADSRDNASQNSLKVEDMNNKIKAAQLEIAKYTTEIKKNGDSTGELHNKIEAAKISIEGYKKTLDASANTLDKLGVSTTDASGKNKDFNSILMDVADKFKAMPDGVEKTADALALFGRSGQGMVKILDQGSQGIQNLEEQAQKLGLTLTAQNIGAINDYIKSQKDLADSTNSIKMQVGTLTAPLMTKFNTALNQAVQNFVGMNAPTRDAAAAMLAFGGPVLSATSAVTGFAGNLSSALPMLRGLKLGLSGPQFIVFTLVITAIGLALLEARHQLGSWGAVLNAVQGDLAVFEHGVRVFMHDALVFAKQALDALMPSIHALVTVFENNLMPQLLRLWQAFGPLLKPLLEAIAVLIGVGLVGAVYILVNALRILADFISFSARLWSDYKNWAVDAWQTVVAVARNVVPAFRDVVGAIGAVLSGVGGLILSPFKWAYDSIVNLFKNLPRELGNAVSGAFGNISNSAKSTLHGLHIPGFATGGFTGMGAPNEVAGVVHKGEYVLPQSQVDQRTGQPKLASGGTTATYNIQQVVLSTADATAEFFKIQDRNGVLASKGLSIARGY